VTPRRIRGGVRLPRCLVQNGPKGSHRWANLDAVQRRRPKK
jgi:hypothetical protein